MGNNSTKKIETGGLEYKIAVFGEGGVGKTSLVKRFVQGVFVDSYDPGIEDSYRKQLSVEGKSVMLDILDSSTSDESYSALFEQWIRMCDGFILCYSIIDENPILKIQDIIKLILRIKDVPNLMHIPIILCGTKCDLESSRIITQGEIKIQMDITLPIIETSAKENIQVNKLFEDMAGLIFHRYNKKKGKGKK